MVATWIAISAASSCRCRLYTAVSRDDLPSLYRTWTARKFLNQVKPSIDRVQGVVDAGWAEAERSHAGPHRPACRRRIAGPRRPLACAQPHPGFRPLCPEPVRLRAGGSERRALSTPRFCPRSLPA